jgi:hypothetical protein
MGMVHLKITFIFYLLFLVLGPSEKNITLNILVYKSQLDAQVTEFIFVWQLLYMFRVSLSPIFRSTKQL